MSPACRTGSVLADGPDAAGEGSDEPEAGVTEPVAPALLSVEATTEDASSWRVAPSAREAAPVRFSGTAAAGGSATAGTAAAAFAEP